MNLFDIIFGTFFGWLFRLCYAVADDFVLTIVAFTLLTKIILLPISLISQKNSIIMAKMGPLLADLQARYEGELDTLIKEQRALYKKERYSAIKAILPLIAQIPIIVGVIGVMNNPTRHIGYISNHYWFGIDLFAAPQGLLVPALAIISTLILCAVQNKYNVISREQGFFGKWGATIFLTVFTWWFVFVCSSGVGLYWACSNMLSIVTLIICNIVYNPKKYIDYENRSVKIKLTRKEKNARRERKKLEKLREREDMKRFFDTKKELVVFSEASGFYKYFQHFINYILDHSDISVHYLTADFCDQVFKIKRERFETYFCGNNGLITTFMKMDSDIVLMTMPDLEVYHYKRSLVRKDIEYIYTHHGTGSFHLMIRKGALDHYDTIFCYSKNHNEEIRETERVYKLPEKRLVNVGFGLLDMLISDYNAAKHIKRDKPQVLIAPSWQKDNILEYCLEPLLDGLFGLTLRIIIRPHPEFVKRFPGKMKQIIDKYKHKNGSDFEIQTDFSSNSVVYNSDLVITDWSTIAQEFSFTTKKPTLFINTPMKIMNPEYKRIGIEPMEIWIRNKIGVAIGTAELSRTKDVVEEILANGDMYKTAIEELLSEYMYNVGCSAEVGGEYIITELKKRREDSNAQAVI